MTAEIDQTAQRGIPDQETPGYRILETPTSLRIIIPKSRIPEILARCKDYAERWSPEHYAKQTVDALEETREVILVSLPDNQTYIRTPFSHMTFNGDKILSYFKILLYQEDDLYERVLKELEGGKKIIISSTLG